MYNRIGFGKRLVAWLIDLIAITVGGLIVGGMFGAVFGFGTGAAVGGATGGPGGAAAGGLMGGVLGGIVGLYVGGTFMSIAFGVWEALTGAALGKLLLRIRIKSDNGTPAPPEKLVGRAALKHSGALIGFLGAVSGAIVLESLAALAGFIIFIGCFFVLGQHRQALHDMIAKTAVYPD